MQKGKFNDPDVRWDAIVGALREKLANDDSLDALIDDRDYENLFGRVKRELGKDHPLAKTLLQFMQEIVYKQQAS